MKQPVFEVREKKAVLVLGIIFTIIFGAMILVMLGAGDLDAAGIAFVSIVFGALTLLGIYLVLAYVCHRVKVFADGEFVYSSSMGKKRTFHYRDIARIEQKYVSTAMSLTLKDAAGNRLAKVESNMDNYDRLCQWLMRCKQEVEAEGNSVNQFGMNIRQEIVVEPVKVQGTGKAGRIFLGLLGVMMLVAAGGVFLSAVAGTGDAGDGEEAVAWFGSTAASDEKQKMNVQMISYAFATFELNDTQGLYFVFDEDMAVYIVCMDNARLETEFADIYEFTFTETLEVPEIGSLEGYAMAIEDDLKELAIEEFNYLWGEEILTADNFSDYMGSYYLDTTYQPTKEGESAATLIISGIFFLGLGIYLLYYAVKGYKKAQQKINEQSGLKQYAKALNAGKEGVGTGTADSGMLHVGNGTAAANTGVSPDVAGPAGGTAQVTGAGDLPVPRNIVLALTAAVFCALAGGVLWILFYKMGRIAAISGYVAVAGAMLGYYKFGRREKSTVGNILCVLIGVAVIVFANYLSYAWEIVDAMNASSPGRAEFAKVFVNMPQLMTDWDLWNSFMADLGMGLVFALLAGLGGLIGRKKKS